MRLRGISSSLLSVSALVSFCGVDGLSQEANDSSQPTIVITSVVGTKRAQTTRRTPVPCNPIEHRFVTQNWRFPKAGESWNLDDGQVLVWKAIEANDKGKFRGPEFAILGHFATEIEVPEDTVMLLDASGHRNVRVNGELRYGDFYDQGLMRIPVALKAGKNELVFRGGRGNSFRGRFVEPPAEVFIEPKDMTLPDVLMGESLSYVAGVNVTNATPHTQEGYTITARLGNDETTTRLPPLSPMSLRQIAIPFTASEPPQDNPVPLVFVMSKQDVEISRAEVNVRLRSPHGTHRRTFISDIDGSVQYFGVTPPTDDAKAPFALVLSLHGAGVQGIRQASSYRAKDWVVHAAPTNRRVFGFDWEDWGRLDALEVLAETRRLYENRRAPELISPVTRWEDMARGKLARTSPTSSPRSHRAPAGVTFGPTAARHRGNLQIPSSPCFRVRSTDHAPSSS